jgi:branched-chain amino acid transport system substrate-binding protein
MPNSSSLVPNLSAKVLANTFQEQTGREWVQSIGGTYSLFEIAHQAFTSVSDPHDHLEVAQALHKVNYHGMSGHLDFNNGPAPGVVANPVVGVQWKESSGKYPFEMKVVDNTLNPHVPVTDHLQPTNP